MKKKTFNKLNNFPGKLSICFKYLFYILLKLINSYEKVKSFFHLMNKNNLDPDEEIDFLSIQATRF